MRTTLILGSAIASFVFTASLAAKPLLPHSPPDSETVVAEMIADYDIDQNNALTQEELASAFEGIRAKHREMRQAQRADADEATQDADRPWHGKRKGHGPHGPRDPEALSASLIEQFDGDEDAALNTAELLEAVEYLHERRFAHRHPFPPPSEAEDGADEEE